MPLYKHMVPWSSAIFSAVLRNHVQVSEFSEHFSLYFPFQVFLHPLHTEGSIWRYLSSNWFGLFNCRKRCQIDKGLTARVRLPAIMINRRAIALLKGEKLQALYPHQGENLWIWTYKLCSKWKPKWQKTSERISTSESLFEQHSRTFAPSHSTPDDQISVLAYSDGELLDYSEDRWRFFGHWTQRSGY